MAKMNKLSQAFQHAVDRYNFTGVKTDSAGRTYQFVDGKRVPRGGLAGTGPRYDSTGKQVGNLNEYPKDYEGGDDPQHAGPPPPPTNPGKWVTERMPDGQMGSKFVPDQRTKPRRRPAPDRSQRPRLYDDMRQIHDYLGDKLNALGRSAGSLRLAVNAIHEGTYDAVMQIAEITGARKTLNPEERATLQNAERQLDRAKEAIHAATPSVADMSPQDQEVTNARRLAAIKLINAAKRHAWRSLNPSGFRSVPTGSRERTRGIVDMFRDAIGKAFGVKTREVALREPSGGFHDRRAMSYKRLDVPRFVNIGNGRISEIWNDYTIGWRKPCPEYPSGSWMFSSNPHDIAELETLPSSAWNPVFEDPKRAAKILAQYARSGEAERYNLPPGYTGLAKDALGREYRFVNGRRVAKGQQSASGQQRPAGGQQRPAGGQQRPAGGQQRQRPAGGQQRPKADAASATSATYGSLGRLQRKLSQNIDNRGVEASDVDVYEIGEDGVTKAACVGVPGMSSPPPPKIPRLPNLTNDERAVETRFANAFEADPDGMARKMIDMMQTDEWQRLGGSESNVFETDAAKLLSDDWMPDKENPKSEANFENMRKYNTALHATANALCKRAFVMYCADLAKDPSRPQTVMATAGGVAAGKGFAIAQSEEVAQLKKDAGAIWDAAGEQNSTELPWIYAQCQKHGFKLATVFVHANPEATWTNPARGVVQRSQDKGRMVDARPFADSYDLGAKNYEAFINHYGPKSQNDNVDLQCFHFDNDRRTPDGSQALPEQVPQMPPNALKIDAEKLYDSSMRHLNRVSKNMLPDVVRGGSSGMRIWSQRASGAKRGGPASKRRRRRTPKR